MAPKTDPPDSDRLSLWGLLPAPCASATMPTPCRHCGAPTVADVGDALGLAAFLTLGVLCVDCHVRQETARGMVEA